MCLCPNLLLSEQWSYGIKTYHIDLISSCYYIKGPISKFSLILRSWELGSSKGFCRVWGYTQFGPSQTVDTLSVPLAGLSDVIL